MLLATFHLNWLNFSHILNTKCVNISSSMVKLQAIIEPGLGEAHFYKSGQSYRADPGLLKGEC